MPILFVPPASIECKKASAKARKIIPKLPIKNTNNAISVPLLQRYTLDLNCEARILEELVPKGYLIDLNSMLNIGDGVKGLQIYVQLATKIKRPQVQKGSATHKASFFPLDGFVYAKLEKAFSGIERMQLIPA